MREGCQWRDDSAGTLERATEPLFWETGMTLDYSHTNDRHQLGHSGARHYILPLYLKSDIGPPATGVPGWAMEWNRIGRSHVL